ncbi:beta-propeller fold lactonase family protein [Paraburkholderia sp. MPAMCS5]|uniref:lactonase family protein n=1 Tax=Paraburkholderia sp. MPAMCS5 TaxID=3112563 RepID=UPI002E19D6BA|nr:beta-propeller fold lactonase family protein [Paraburkholderia sp. MPAMCS5]
MPRLFAYVGCRTTRERHAAGTGIGVYEVSASGAWRHVQTLEPLVNPSYLALNISRRTLYTVHGDGGTVSAYRIDAASGRLSALNSQSCEGRNPVHLALSRDGSALVVAGYATGTATRIALQANGALGEPLLPPLEFIGTPGPHRVEQASSHPHHIARYVTRFADTDWHIVPDKGLDTVFAVRWNDDGSTVVREGHAREGAGPRHAAFHPGLPLVYVSNELDSTITTWSFDSSTGTLAPLQTVSVVPSGFHALTRAAGIVIAADGRCLYVTNRGHDSIATIALSEETGVPQTVEWTASKGQCPRFLCLSPDDRALYVANEISHTIVQYEIDAHTKLPIPTGRVIETGSPVCIAFATIEE